MLSLSLPTVPSARDEARSAILAASRDPTARRRRELLEQNAHLVIPDVPARLSDETASRLLGTSIARTMTGDR